MSDRIIFKKTGAKLREVLERAAKEHGVTFVQLAEALGFYPTELFPLMTGKRRITAYVAIYLEALGKPASYWLSLVMNEELELSRKLYKAKKLAFPKTAAKTAAKPVAKKAEASPKKAKPKGTKATASSRPKKTAKPAKKAAAIVKGSEAKAKKAAKPRTKKPKTEAPEGQAPEAQASEAQASEGLAPQPVSNGLDTSDAAHFEVSSI